MLQYHKSLIMRSRSTEPAGFELDGAAIVIAEGTRAGRKQRDGREWALQLLLTVVDDVVGNLRGQNLGFVYACPTGDGG